jgi:histidinol dehydrogenase
MKIIMSGEFDAYWKKQSVQTDDTKTEKTVKQIIDAVRKDGDKAVKKFASRFDRTSPDQLEVPLLELHRAYGELRANDPALTEALEFAAKNIYSFSQKQREQFSGFECETEKGIFTGQRVIPVERAAVYVPGGRFPLFSSVLMGLLPAFSAGVEQVFFSSPPAENGIPDQKILAAAAIAAKAAGVLSEEKENVKRFRVFAIGGAQAIAAFAFGTETAPRADVIAGPGNRFVAAAKRLLFGQVGIDFIAGPSDVLVVCDGAGETADLAAADMLAQAEHDPDARARALVPSMGVADKITAALYKRLSSLTAANAVCGKAARASIDNGALIVVYQNKDEAVRIANAIAPEHLELLVADAPDWVPKLKNYGSLFIGALSAEALGDYSAGINHTLPTSGTARFTGGLSVRHFLKTVTTLRCENGEAYTATRQAAERLARAEGLEAHALSAACRIDK